MGQQGQTPERQSRCPEANVLSAVVGDSGAGWVPLSNREASSGSVSSQRPPVCALGGSRTTARVSDEETQSKTGAWRHCTGLSETALAIISFLVIWLWVSFYLARPCALIPGRVTSSLSKWKRLIAIATMLPESGWESHQTAVQGGWGCLPAANQTHVCNPVCDPCVKPHPATRKPMERAQEGRGASGGSCILPPARSWGTACHEIWEGRRLLAHTSCNKEGSSPLSPWRKPQSAASLEQSLQFSPVSAPSCSSNS